MGQVWVTTHQRMLKLRWVYMMVHIREYCIPTSLSLAQDITCPANIIFMGITEPGWNIRSPAFSLGGLCVTFGWGSIRCFAVFVVFAMWTRASPEVGGFRGGHGKVELLFGAVRALCKNTPWVGWVRVFKRASNAPPGPRKPPPPHPCQKRGPWKRRA